MKDEKDSELEVEEKDECDEDIEEAQLKQDSSTVHSENVTPARVVQNEPITVIYCPKCTWPVEYCEFGQSYASECLPWIRANCPEVFGEQLLVDKMGEASLEDGTAEGDGEGKKKKRGGVGVPRKKAAAGEVRVVVSRVQRQKRKFVTVITGLETVAELKIKDVARACGRKFSSGASVGDTVTGAKEVVIQGDVYFDVPTLLISEFKIAGTCIYMQDDGGGVQAYA